MQNTKQLEDTTQIRKKENTRPNIRQWESLFDSAAASRPFLPSDSEFHALGSSHSIHARGEDFPVVPDGAYKRQLPSKSVI